MDTPDTAPAAESKPETWLAGLREAYEQKQESRYFVFTLLKEIIDDAYAYAEREESEPMLAAPYFLAGWRETAAYGVLVHLMRHPQAILDRVFAVQVQRDLPRILASVYDGNPAPLKVLIEDEDAEVEMRSAALYTFHVLQSLGLMPAAEVKAYLRHLLDGGLPRKRSHLWEMVMLLAGELPAPELFPDIYAAYDAGLMDGGSIPLSVLNARLGATGPVAPDDATLIDDPIAEIEAWMKSVSSEAVESGDYSNLGVGRNDPCPCGSGKKYKKCCGRN
jgi:hypothetical protein